MSFALMALGWLRKVPREVWLCLAFALAVLWLRSHWIGVGEDRVQARWDAENAAEAVAAAKAADEARKIEERHRADLAAAAERFLTEQRIADEKHQATVAALRAGTLRVRERFTCPRVPGTATDPAGADAENARGLGVEDAAAILGAGRAADEAARRLNALIEILEREGR